MRSKTKKLLAFMASEIKATFLHQRRDIKRELILRLIILVIFMPGVFLLSWVIPQEYLSRTVVVLITIIVFSGIILPAMKPGIPFSFISMWWKLQTKPKSDFEKSAESTRSNNDNH